MQITQALNKLQVYSESRRIPLDDLLKTLEEPKVDCMIRGVASEFDILNRLVQAMPGYEVFKNNKSDLWVQKKGKKPKAVEAKLAAKHGFKARENGDNITDYQHILEIAGVFSGMAVLETRDIAGFIRVKCHKSRTTGDKVAIKRASKLGISPDLIKMHRDQYYDGTFDYVIARIFNAFPKDKTKYHEKFLNNIGVNNDDDLYKKLYWSKSTDLISTEYNPVCNRQDCDKNCRFIPNYPLMIWLKGSSKPLLPWQEVS